MDKGKWMYDTTKGYYHAVSHFEGSEFDCNGRIKPKDCVVEKYLVGQKDAPGGTCPRGTHQFGEHCCCMDGCCGLIVAGDTKGVALLTVVYLLFQMQDG